MMGIICGSPGIKSRSGYSKDRQITLTEKECEKFREPFKLFDKDGTGKITSSNVDAIMRKMGLSPTEAELKEFINEKGKDGMIDFEDFVNMMVSRQNEDDDTTKDEELLAAFRAFDKDGNGTIEEDELKLALKNIDENFSDNEIALMMKAADKNGDGKIDFNEFVRMVNLL